MYEITLSRTALKVLSRMPRTTARRIRAGLDELAQDPHRPNNNVTRLVGSDGWRLRVGDWRVIYLLEDEALRIIVIKVAPRGGTYR